MARYLLLDNPVMYWPGSGLEPVTGYIYRSGHWWDGKGYWVGATLGAGKAEAIGILQWDGTFCPALTGPYYARYGSKYNVKADDLDYVALIGGRFSGEDFFDPFYLQFDGSDYAKPSDYATHVRASLTDYYSYFGVEAGTGLIGVHKGIWRQTYFWKETTYVGLDPMPAGAPTISHKVDNEWYIIYPNGQGVVYDFNLRQVVNTGIYIDDHSSYWLAETTYCKEYDLFFTLTKDYLDGETTRVWEGGSRFRDRPTRLKVYANEGKPASFAPMTMAPDPCPVGQVATLETTLLGAQGEPIEDYLTNWTIYEGEGTLVSRQSTTDSEGRASVQLRSPASPVSTGVRVEVVY